MRRTDFPIFETHPELVYLDSAATSQKPLRVIESVTSVYERTNANIHRGIYDLSQAATDQFEASRSKVATFVGASAPEEIIFTSGATEAINLVATGWGRRHLKPGDIVVTSEMEHHSNLVPWMRLRDEVGIELFYLPVGSDYRLDWQSTKGLDMSRVKLIALTHASNVLGTINPIAEVADYFRQQGASAKLMVDASQSVPHIGIDVGDLGADFLAFSSHKMLGPSGVGILWAKREILDDMDPMLVGSNMIRTVTKENATWAAVPDKFESGTRNIEGAIGLGSAIDYLEEVGFAAVATHERELTVYLLEQLLDDDQVTVFGPSEPVDRLGVVSFAVGGVHAHDVAEILNRNHVAVRAGHHCAQPLMARLGVAGTARASLYLYNTKADIDALVSGIAHIKQTFKV